MRTRAKIVGIATVLLAGMTASAWAQGRGPMSGNPVFSNHGQSDDEGRSGA
jgi:hypothetical protein